MQQPQFDLLLERYANMVYRLAYSRTNSKADNDDIMQEVFLRCLKRGPCIQSKEHRKAWLIRTTINCSKNLLASAWFRRTAPLDEQLSCPKIQEDSVVEVVGRLPAKYRTVVHLFYYEDLSVTQIGTILGKKETTIKTWLHRARAMLREKLTERWINVP